MPRISLLIETCRYGGLDWQLKLLSRQTFKDFEIILIDGCHERQDSVCRLAKDLNLNLIYLKEEFPYPVEHVRPFNVNKCIAASQGECCVFLDDYHIIPENFLESHYEIFSAGYAGILHWERIKGLGNVDYTTIPLDIVESDPRLEKLNEYVTKFKDWYLDVPWDWWWPNSTSVPREYLIEVDGFNELYAGGTGGEDNDISYRMRSAGLRYAYNPNVTVYHVEHKPPKDIAIPMRPLPHNDTIKCTHRMKNEMGPNRPARCPFTKNEHWPHGNPNLIENDELYTWFESGYKLFRCKFCGEIGMIDGIQGLENTKIRAKNDILTPPSFIHIPNSTAYHFQELSNSNPLISVIIPIYNRAEYLAYSLFLYCKQTMQNFEIIIMDDGSTDNVYEVCKFYKEKLNIRYFRSDRKQNPYYGSAGPLLNFAIRNVAKTDIILYSDPEVMPFPDFVENHYKSHIPGNLIIEPEFIAAGVKGRNIDPITINGNEFVKGLTLKMWYEHRSIFGEWKDFKKQIPNIVDFWNNTWKKIINLPKGYIGDPNKGYEFGSGEQHFWGFQGSQAGLSFPKQVILDIGGWDESLEKPGFWMGEDGEMGARASKLGVSSQENPNIRAVHIYHFKPQTYSDQERRELIVKKIEDPNYKVANIGKDWGSQKDLVIKEIEL